ncbi:alpha/beta fold hydrolase [Lewinella sp. JB7]|uniref:alpha/beta fold hydrolase n=1 Tax=Lewinella sp. JB7 TaxID=2962887 RepID=UPI0020C94A87|nr:alpha/beta hydrolase [Lewinella sp. JB7]MCP9236611.1 alpha/beta hydrolase [Lewinella sp. JB7]
MSPYRLFVLVLLLSVSLAPLVGQSGAVLPLDERLTDYGYPYPARVYEFTSQLQQLEMIYMDETPARHNGKTVVLLHGKNFPSAYWKSTMNLLLEQGYRVIAPDQIGFGKSSKPRQYQFTFQDLAHNTRWLLYSLRIDEAIVVGHSMGGMLATRFALMYPEITTSLILVNPIGLEDWKLKVPYQTVTEWYEGELKKDYASIREYQQTNYYAGEWKDAYDPWVYVQAGWAASEDYAYVAWNAALTYDMIFTQPVVYEFSELQMPTVLILGTRDRTALGKPLVSEEVRQTMGRYDQLGSTIVEQIPRGTLIKLDGLGHLPHIENFDRFARAFKQALNATPDKP